MKKIKVGLIIDEFLVVLELLMVDMGFLLAGLLLSISPMI